jgi:hypothetical protein
MLCHCCTHAGRPARHLTTGVERGVQRYHKAGRPATSAATQTALRPSAVQSAHPTSAPIVTCGLDIYAASGRLASCGRGGSGLAAAAGGGAPARGGHPAGSALPPGLLLRTGGAVCSQAGRQAGETVRGGAFQAQSSLDLQRAATRQWLPWVSLPWPLHLSCRSSFNTKHLPGTFVLLLPFLHEEERHAQQGSKGPLSKCNVPPGTGGRATHGGARQGREVSSYDEIKKLVLNSGIVCQCPQPAGSPLG